MSCLFDLDEIADRLFDDIYKCSEGKFPLYEMTKEGQVPSLVADVELCCEAWYGRQFVHIDNMELLDEDGKSLPMDNVGFTAIELRDCVNEKFKRLWREGS